VVPRSQFVTEQGISIFALLAHQRHMIALWAPISRAVAAGVAAFGV
jgi:hypothetical protein